MERGPLISSVSVVIPTLNGGRLFADVMSGLRRQRFSGTVEILVIDSGSTDGTVGVALEAGARVVEIPHAEFDHGTTRNRGMEMTTGEIIVMLTQDATPTDERLIDNLIKPFEDSGVAGAFARQIPRPEHDVLVARNIENWVAGSMQRRMARIADRAEYERMAPMERYILCVFDNVCSAVRRSTWVEIPFRQCTFGEDVDWAKRVLEAGWGIVYEPTAAVMHSHERPAGYEYRRTYVCHRTLYRLFGLSTIPMQSKVPECLWRSMTGDIAYVMKRERRLGKKMATLARIPRLSWASVMGQYRGARDERTGRGRTVAGV
jgi:rhamnosyltransferase